jgi:hypothetical protein
MQTIIIIHGNRYIPAILLGDTGMAEFGRDFSFPIGWRRAKTARRYARRKWGAGNLLPGTWELDIRRHPAASLQAGHCVAVKPHA